MEFPQTYTDLYIRSTQWRHFNLVFYNKDSGDLIAFDGIFFAFIPNGDFDNSLFTKLDYSEKKGGYITIEGITSDYDTSYIKFIDGDIFELFFSIDDVSNKQRIIKHFAGENGYTLALRGFNMLKSAEIVELRPGASVIGWLKNKSS